MNNLKNPIDIIMVSWQREDMTERVIRCLKRNTITPYKLHLIDNGSNREMKLKLTQLANEELVNNLLLLEENWGLEPARNLGLFYVKSDLFVTTDNDILPEKPTKKEDWLSKLILLMEKHPDYGAIACRTQVMIGTGNIFEGQDKEDIVEFSHPGGSLRIMRTALIKEVGGWRDEIKGRGQEEMYICGKLHQLGYKTGFATEIKCYHLFGKDQNWGYGDLKPEEHGHKPISHPALTLGDNEEEIFLYEI